MKQLILLFSLTISMCCLGQTDFKKHSALLLDAHRAFTNQSFKEALQDYEEAFLIQDPNRPLDYLNAAICAAELKLKDQCKAWITASITRAKVSIETIQSVSNHPLYVDIAKDVISQYETLINAYYVALENPSAYYKIQALLARDQFSRTLNDYYLGISEEEKEIAFSKFLIAQEKKDTVAQKKYKALLFPKIDDTKKAYELQVMRYTDSLNIVELIDITKKYGWQKEAHLLLWHQRGTYGTDNWVWSYFKPLINDEIQSGKITPSFWAIFEDFKSINESGKSIYGFHPGKVNPKTVNLMREKIGLPRLTESEIKHRNENPYGGRLF